MSSELKTQIAANETTVIRWKEERLSRFLSQSVKLPGDAATAFYKIVDRFPGGFRIETLREAVGASLPSLWKLMPPPNNENQWKEYLNDLLTDCAVNGCMTVKEVWQIIGYDPEGFEKMRGSGFTFLQAFDALHENETDEQMDERTKDLTLEEYKERFEHAIEQYRQSLKQSAYFSNQCFEKFGTRPRLTDQ